MENPDKLICCCNYDCKKYPSTPESCLNKQFKCVWYVIAIDVLFSNYKNQ